MKGYFNIRILHFQLFCSCLGILFSCPLYGQASYRLSGRVLNEDRTPLTGATIFIKELEKGTSSSSEGKFDFASLSPQTYTLAISYIGKNTTVKTVSLQDKDLDIAVTLIANEATIDEITVMDSKADVNYGIQHLRAVEGNAIYAAKKNELIHVDRLNVNKATNNSRQIYSKVSGLNIWESDGAGVQLAIGGRGLSPSRNSNFNTRQNGYDISADALGYPESYYSPPAEAVDRIEVIRGAASLQYGTQFGGMINFKLKQGAKDKKIAVETRQTVGSFGLFSSFNSIGGTVGKVNYYGYYQYKHSDGWRPNSGIDQHTAYLRGNIQLGNKFSIHPEYTHTNYLAQQPGGLTDIQFQSDPRQSNRERNWFRVDWNLFALNFKYKFTDRLRMNSQFFGLLGGRDAIGNLGPINQLDFGQNRDFLSDDFKNWGNETRLLYRYTTFGNPSTLLVGGRYYEGETLRRQGEGDNTSEANFQYLNPNNLENSDFVLPSKNISLFAENIFTITPKWSITPGMRFEWIKTKADGYYRIISKDLAGNTINDERINEKKVNQRQFAFFGVGSSYKFNEKTEFYANFSQNYRAINFNDIRVNVGSLVVDENLKDEHGFNFDLGGRGRIGDFLDYDISVFYLVYRDKIGSILKREPNPIFGGLVDRVIRYRTNVADAHTLGFESVLEFQIFKLLNIEPKNSNLSYFTNLSFTHAKYKKSQQNGVDGNDVELVPPFMFKMGLNYTWKDFKASYQYSYTAQHFSDASNAVLSPTAIEGIIPSYSIMDISLSYKWRRFKIAANVDNLMDSAYFTRRATGYPGPGIIPSQGRSFYLTLGARF